MTYNPLYDALKFVRQHGMTREGQSKALFYEQFIREYESGDIPATIPAERHLPKARAQYARCRPWLGQTTADLIDLEATETRLRSMVRAPEATGRRSRQEDGEQSDRKVDAATLETERVKQEHVALAAKEALEQLAPRLKIKRAQVKVLEGRAAEFFEPARDEAYEEAGVKAIVDRERRALDEARAQADAIYHDIKATLQSDPRTMIRPVK
jgi:hypothetical protein